MHPIFDRLLLQIRRKASLLFLKCDAFSFETEQKTYPLYPVYTTDFHVYLIQSCYLHKTHRHFDSAVSQQLNLPSLCLCAIEAAAPTATAAALLPFLGSK